MAKERMAPIPLGISRVRGCTKRSICGGFSRTGAARPRHCATVLDKSLRPVEALIRYRLFLHQLEIEKIDAYGRAYGNMADALAQARQRVVILEKQTR